MNRVNLHLHTSASDGLYDYKSVIMSAINSGLKIISITDHDNVETLPDVINFVNDKNITLISGVELTANYDIGTCHILGYNFDISSIHNFNQYIKESRINKAKKIINVISSLGYEICYDDVLHCCSNGVIGKHDIAMFLVSKGYFDCEQEAINKIFNNELVSGFKTASRTIDEVVDAIKESGGIAVLAHPWTLNLNLEQLREFVILHKFDGIEVYNHNIKYEFFLELDKLADDLELFKTCGTDYHGNNKYNEFVVSEDVDCSKFVNYILGGYRCELVRCNKKT